ncbi:DNA ligase 1 [Penicillium malachiteum]|uniref:DNA ligase n=1 Tax=Penicillium malachiteum TaxID=1324776 RepID=A0AAD6HH27_9EURO|nr:DNA ligase 1 [Penicillium malachiteum]
MTDDKSRKQATLGRFFGSDANASQAPKKQTTLAFGGKKPKMGIDALDGSAENTAPQKDDDMVDVKDEGETAVSAATEEPEPAKNLKREMAEEGNESEDSDVQPVTKRRRKASKDSSSPPPKSSPKKTPKKRAASPAASKSPKAKATSSSPKANVKKAAKEEIAEEQAKSDKEEEEQSESDEEDAKPEAKKKTMEKVQATLKSSGNDPYPDWKAGDPVPYAALCTTFSLVEMTTKRLIILAYCSQFLQQVLRLTPNDLLPTVQLMINKLAADYAGIELGIGESLIMKAIGESTGRSLAVIKTDQHEIGDLGLVAAKSRSNQPTMFKPKALTVRGVHEGLLGIAKVPRGVDITKEKGGPSEAKFIVRFLEGKLRLGLAERTVLVALAQAIVTHEAAVKGKKATPEQMAEGETILKTVYSELPAYEEIVPAILKHGLAKLSTVCKLQPGVPLKPMLAKPTKSITEVLDRFEGKEFTCEYKYDGERAQIHFVASSAVDKFPTSAITMQKDSKGLSAIFSRNSEDLSKKYPDVLGKLDTWIKDDVSSFVLDCETVAWDTVNKKVLPFQQLMTRKRKDVKAEDVKVKVCVFAFDLLFFNGEPCVKKSLRERRDLLHKCFQPVEGEFQFAQFGNTNVLDEIQDLLEDSVKSSCEGLMVKMLDTEESGYEPSKRSRNWLKVKKDYLAGVGDSLDLVVLGAYYGRGKRTSVYGAFLLAAYNPNNEKYETICNIGTGFSEAVLEEFHKALKPMVIDRPKPFYAHSSVPKDQPDVWFEPRLVWEVKTADLTLSPRYQAAADEFEGTTGGGKGVSLRFPRFIKSRDDKKPEQATTTRAVAEMYRKQEAVAKENSGKKGVDDDFEY